MQLKLEKRTVTLSVALRFAQAMVEGTLIGLIRHKNDQEKKKKKKKKPKKSSKRRMISYAAKTDAKKAKSNHIKRRKKI